MQVQKKVRHEMLWSSRETVRGSGVRGYTGDQPLRKGELLVRVNKGEL